MLTLYCAAALYGSLSSMSSSHDSLEYGPLGLPDDDDSDTPPTPSVDIPVTGPQTNEEESPPTSLLRNKSGASERSTTSPFRHSEPILPSYEDSRFLSSAHDRFGPPFMYGGPGRPLFIPPLEEVDENGNEDDDIIEENTKQRARLGWSRVTHSSTMALTLSVTSVGGIVPDNK